MENIKNKLFDLLRTIHGNGSFETFGEKDFMLPGMLIDGIGEIGFPISPIQIREIIKVSKKAPFGKGSKTIIDTKIRSAWELNADQLSFHNEDWKKFLGEIIEKVKDGLGIENHPISLSLYKLLIYEEGDFFLSHKDSEKELGMFGTLIIGLPSAHTGGELSIRFDGKEKIIDFSSPSRNYQMPYVAFFADCDHEIKPITSGYRVSLVYNLLQDPGAQILNQSKVSAEVEQMAIILKSLADSISNKPTAVLLGHQYTPANFSLMSLKHHDKPRAELLLQAAEKAGFFAGLGLVTHYKMGDLDGGDYYRSYNSRHSESSGDGTMGDIHEEYSRIEHWSNGDIPSLGSIDIETKDLISDFEIGEDDPIEEEEEGYTGNAGMTIEYWYHYGAVILWPKSKHLELLSLAPVPIRLKWLEYYYQNWNNSALNSIELSKHLITQFSEAELIKPQFTSPDFSIVTAILAKLKNEKFILDNCQPMLAVVFKNIQAQNWIELLQQYDPKIFTPIYERVANRDDVYSINHILEILRLLCSIHSPSLELEVFCQHHIQHIPNYLAHTQLFKIQETDSNVFDRKISRKETIISILEKVIELSYYKETDQIWINSTLEIITKSLSRTYVNKVLAVIIQNKKGLLAKKIKQICVINLNERTAVKPTPPVNWKREVPDTKNDKEIWMILTPFLESTDTLVFEYKKGESYRNQMQTAIVNVTIDLKMETIKKGSPHILKITKTQGAYDLALKNWREDLEILETLNRIPL